MLTKTKQKIIKIRKLWILKKKTSGVWRIVNFPQNLAWIHAAVFEKPELTDGRTGEGRTTDACAMTVAPLTKSSWAKTWRDCMVTRIKLRMNFSLNYISTTPTLVSWNGFESIDSIKSKLLHAKKVGFKFRFSRKWVSKNIYCVSVTIGDLPRFFMWSSPHNLRKPMPWLLGATQFGWLTGMTGPKQRRMGMLRRAEDGLPSLPGSVIMDCRNLPIPGAFYEVEFECFRFTLPGNREDLKPWGKGWGGWGGDTTNILTCSYINKTPMWPWRSASHCQFDKKKLPWNCICVWMRYQ